MIQWGGGVVAGFFRDLQEPTRFSGGGVSVISKSLRGSVGGGGSSRIFPCSVISSCEIKFLPNIK